MSSIPSAEEAYQMTSTANLERLNKIWPKAEKVLSKAIAKAISRGRYSTSIYMIDICRNWSSELLYMIEKKMQECCSSYKIEVRRSETILEAPTRFIISWEKESMNSGVLTKGSDPTEASVAEPA